MIIVDKIQLFGAHHKPSPRSVAREFTFEDTQKKDQFSHREKKIRTNRRGHIYMQAVQENLFFKVFL